MGPWGRGYVREIAC